MGKDPVDRFPPYGRYLIDYQSDPFSDRSRDVAMATNFRVKMGEIGRLIFIRRLGILKMIEISQCRFQKVQCKNV